MRVPKIGDDVTLSVVEDWFVRSLHAAIKVAGRKGEMCDSKTETAASDWKSLNGRAGEIAFGKMSGLYPDLDIRQEKERNDWDYNFQGWRLDVKCTHVSYGVLLVAPHKTGYAVDAYALMIGSIPGPYVFKGFYPHAELCQPNRLREKHPSKPAGFEATQKQLIEWGDCVLWLTRECENPPLRR